MALGDILATVMVVIRAETSELIAKLRGAPAEAKAAGEATGAAFSQGVSKGLQTGGVQQAAADLKKQLGTIPQAAIRPPGEDIGAYMARTLKAQGASAEQIALTLRKLGLEYKGVGVAAQESAGALKAATAATEAHGAGFQGMARHGLLLRRELYAIAGAVALLTVRFREAQQFELGVRFAERTRSLSGALSALHAAAKEEEARGQLVEGMTQPQSFLQLAYSTGALLFKQGAGTIAAQGVRATGAAEKLYAQFQLPQETATAEAKLLQIRAQAAELDARRARTMPEFRAASAEEARLLAESNKQQQEAVRIKADQARQEMESLKVATGPLQAELAALELKRAGLTAGGPRTIMQATPRGPREITIDDRAAAGLLKSLDEEIAKQRALVDANNERSKIAAGILFLAEREQAILRATLGVEQERNRLAKAQEEIRRETAHQAFGVGMGRVTLQGEMAFLRGAMVDPRRTTEEQEAAEHALLETRKRGAEDLVKHQHALGVSTWEQQLGIAKGFLAETTQGSQQWFDSVQKVSEVYVGIHEQAKQIAAEMISLAGAERMGAAQREQELAHQVDARIHLAALSQQMQRSAEAEAAARQKADAADEALIARSGKPEHLTPRQQQEREVEAARERIRQRAEDAEEQARQRAMTGGMALRRYWEEQQRFAASKMSLADVPGFMDQARLRDEALLSGAVRGTPAELGIAVGRQDFWRTVERERLSPQEAFASMARPPQAEVARALAPPAPLGNEGITLDWTGRPDWMGPAHQIERAPTTIMDQLAAFERSGARPTGPEVTGTAGELGALSQAMAKPGQEMSEFTKAFRALMDRFEAGIAHMKADVEHVAQVLANMLNDQYRAAYGRR